MSDTYQVMNGDQKINIPREVADRLYAGFYAPLSDLTPTQSDAYVRAIARIVIAGSTGGIPKHKNQTDSISTFKHKAYHEHAKKLKAKTRDWNKKGYNWQRDIKKALIVTR